MKIKGKTIKQIEKEVERVAGKMIKDYGCVFLALQWDDESFIEECEKTGHKLYHKIKGRNQLKII